MNRQSNTPPRANQNLAPYCFRVTIAGKTHEEFYMVKIDPVRDLGPDGELHLVALKRYAALQTCFDLVIEYLHINLYIVSQNLKCDLPPGTISYVTKLIESQYETVTLPKGLTGATDALAIAPHTKRIIELCKTAAEKNYRITSAQIELVSAITTSLLISRGMKLPVPQKPDLMN